MTESPPDWVTACPSSDDNAEADCQQKATQETIQKDKKRKKTDKDHKKVKKKDTKSDDKNARRASKQKDPKSDDHKVKKMDPKSRMLSAAKRAAEALPAHTEAAADSKRGGKHMKTGHEPDVQSVGSHRADEDLAQTQLPPGPLLAQSAASHDWDLAAELRYPERLAHPPAPAPAAPPPETEELSQNLSPRSPVEVRTTPSPERAIVDFLVGGLEHMFDFNAATEQGIGTLPDVSFISDDSAEEHEVHVAKAIQNKKTKNGNIHFSFL